MTTSYYSHPTLFSQVSNPDSDSSLVSENDYIKSNNDGATDTVQWDEGGKYPSYNVCGI